MLYVETESSILKSCKVYHNYAKSIQQLIEVFSVWYECQKTNIYFIQIFASYIEWKSSFIHQSHP